MQSGLEGVVDVAAQSHFDTHQLNGEGAHSLEVPGVTVSEVLHKTNDLVRD